MTPEGSRIALLRAINLGARNRVAMPELRALLTRLGYEDVATLVQSGNVVLTTTRTPAELGAELQREIAAAFGVDTPVIVRTRDELAAVVTQNPLPGAVADPKRFQVSFLSEAPDAAVVRALESADLAPEQVAVRGREVYALHPNGIHRSPLARLLGDRRLGVTATARNWSTVTKLLELADRSS
ncbi:MAG: DUF1697 domain-containing protein [Solirubrobacteraceae bacterium]